ncbi:hypothetical protein CYMTET_52012 [Cymbomonas tetramitiformis]|uniref:Uncharacterized protein n=1 Tax=Cymbomonas tetramitiformis TaxID=36881 RepID=A0AAE0BL67_9CHLO|nr:hypothetical protein CYMTET_52012 [Cymbomonas tetramitiformis]
MHKSTKARASDSGHDWLGSKIQKYEEFMDRLKRDLRHAIGEREKTQKQLDSYRDLADNVKMLGLEGIKDMRSLVNLGSEFFVQAQVTDTSKLFVNVGLGFHVELTHEETSKFVENKLAALHEDATRKSEQVRTHG